MASSQHVDAQTVIDQSKEHPQKKHGHGSIYYRGPSYMRDEEAAQVPKYTMVKEGISSRAAYQLLHDETYLDGNPALNLASYVHTWMPPEAEKLFIENLNKNLIDIDEYPAAASIHNRCISIIADLWKAPKDCKPIGTATAGSSEGIILGGLSLKRRWQDVRKKAGKDDTKPNIVFGANAQVALEKFARYFDVESRLVPVKASYGFVMDPSDALAYIDENTIGVMVTLGSTYTGDFENVKLMSDLLDSLQARTGLDIQIHVDGASGGFIAPFAYPSLEWSFNVSRVISINSSGHKFGLVYPGLGWVVWKDESYLHKGLVFEVDYLGGTEYNFTLNFSKPAAPVMGQMFNFLNLGFNGYKRIAYKGLRNARLLSRALEASTYFKVLSSIHKPVSQDVSKRDSDNPEHYHRGVPAVAFRLSDDFKKKYPFVKQSWIQVMIKTKGWIIPNYSAPPNEEGTEILRVVVRETLSEDLIERLITDLLEVTEGLTAPGNFVIITGPGIVHQPDRVFGRTDPSNLAGEGELPEQVGFSRLC